MNESDSPFPTRVSFRRWRGHSKSVIAILWDVPDVNPGRVMMYEHIGQHGEGVPGIVVYDTRPATVAEPDTAALKAELESLGYVLRAVARRPSK